MGQETPDYAEQLQQTQLQHAAAFFWRTMPVIRGGPVKRTQTVGWPGVEVS